MTEISPCEDTNVPRTDSALNGSCIFFPNVQISKNSAKKHGLLDLIQLKDDSVVGGSEKFKTRS